MPARSGNSTYVPGKGDTGRTKKKAKKAVKVSVPYAPTKKGKEAEEAARGHVTVPYAPTPTGKAAERQAKAEKAERAAARSLRKIRKTLRDQPKPVDPHFEYQKAKYEGEPISKEFRKAFPRAAKKAETARFNYIRDREHLKEDPAAEFVISSAATAGLGLGAKAIGTAAEKALLARAGSEALSTGATATEKAVETGAKAVAKKVAGKAGTKEGRRELAAAEAKRVAKAGKRAKKKPVRYSGLANAAAPPLGVSHTSLPETANALVEGHVNALKDNPGKTLKTTARAIPAIVTAPAAILGSAGSSVVHGTPKPLEEEVSKQASGLKEIGEHLLSGDPKEVQRAVEDEVGLSFVVPIPALSRLKKTDFYRDSRGKLRLKVAKKRELTRAKRRSELADFKGGGRTKRPRKIRHAVVDTATGEERILRRTGKLVEGHRQRRQTSRDIARRKAQGEREAALAARDVIKEVRRSKLSKGDHNIGDTLATVAQYGISRNKERAMKQLDEIEASIGSVHPDEIPAGTITDLSNIKWLRDHPEAFSDKHFWKAVDAYKKQAKEIETSGRKKVLAVGDVYGLARPEERLEAGVKVKGRTVRSNFYKDEATLQRKQAELGELRADARRNRVAAETASPEARAKHAAIATEIGARAKALERELKDYRGGLKQARKDYVREAQATIQEKGLEQPAYVKDVKPREAGETQPSYGGGRPSRKQHMAGIEQSRRGVTMARDFETLVNQSIAEPRLRRHIHDSTTDFVERWAQDVGGKRYVTSNEFNRAVNRGEIDPTQYAKLHSQFFKQAVLDPYKSGDSLAGELQAALKGEVLNRANDAGNKYVVIPKEALQEFVHQMEPPKGMDKLFGGANRLLSRVILGYSPAWAIAQLVAEGIPASIAIGMNPARWARVVNYLKREDKKLSRKDRAALDGTVGESAGVTPHPQIQFKPDTNMQASRFFRLSSRNRIGRALLKGASGEALSVFDRWKGGKYRKAVLAAKADRELNGFVKNLGKLMKGQRSIVEAIKGKPLKEQMEYIARHPKEAARLESYLDDVMGNWRALTRHEAKFAPLIVFYPFVRYSLRWMFWSFPKEHPVKASILYFLAQQNSDELEKLIGGPPANFLDYATPVFTGSHGTDAVLPGGSRIAPGTNALVTAIGKGKVESLASGLNPAIGLAGAAIYGVDSYTGEKVADTPQEHALLALNALLSLPAPVRLLKLNKLGEGEQSPSSKVYEATDPNRGLRSFALPFLPQPGSKFRKAQRFSENQRLKYSDPIASIFDNPEVGEALFGPNGKVDWPKVKRLVKEHKISEKASDAVKKAESGYFGEEGDFTDEQSKALQMLQGGLLIKPPKKKPNPFGLPDTDSSALREQFGLPSTSASDLRKQFGIE